ncbi:CotH kinase family protein [Phycisphaeraceae bacterium D3-23]
MPDTTDARLGHTLSSANRPPSPVEALEPRMLFSAVPLITELLAVNNDGLEDEDGNNSDWLELHNAGDMALNLDGWFLTDDASDLEQWALPNVTLGVGEYLVIFASGEDRAAAGGELHTNFRLGSGGEYLALVEPDGNTIAHEYAPEFPAQSSDVSYGLAFDNPGSPGYFNTPTPGQANGAAAVNETVTFSHTANVFTGSFQLTLSGAGAGQTISYTLDGSVPHSGSPTYSGPITINSTTQVRALIREVGMVDGRVTTMSYSRLGADVQAFASQLPILLIENFGGGAVPAKGWNQTGDNIVQVPRQSSAITIFDNSSGTSSFTGPVDLHSRTGIRERGAFSSTFPEPQYSLETWGEADDDQDVEVFGMAGESDWILYSPNPQYDQTLMNNQFMYALANQMGLWAPQVRYVEAFLNTDGGDVTMADHVGLYVWTEKVKRDPGRLDFEAFNADGTEGGFLLSINRQDAIPEGLPSNTVQPHFHTAGANGIQQTPPNSFGVGDDIPRQSNAFINYEHPNGYEISQVQRNAIGDWFQEMEDVLFGRAGVTWNDPVEGYSKYIDVDNFIDYFILHNLSKNGDGLLLSMWVYNPDPNNGGKLRMGPPWDHDLGSFEGSTSSSLLHRADRLWYGRMFQDPAFVQQYQDRWQMWRQSVLTDANMNAVFDSFVAEIGNDAIVRDGVTNITSRINAVKSWLASRAAAIDAQFTAPPLFSQNGGEVDPGFGLSMTALAGTIYYTNDGSDPRLANGNVSPGALLYDGTAVGTQLITTGSNWRYLDNGTNQGTAWRNAGFNDTAWASGDAQLGYGDGDESTVVSYGPNETNKYITTYFRSTFNVADPSAFTSVVLNLLRDDGASVYINGEEVVRSNMPGVLGDNTITYTTPAAATVNGNAESTLFFAYNIDAADLIVGTNTIAVEIHQSVVNSSDISFDLELIGQTASDQPITLNQTQTITARSRNGTSWSGMAQADFFVGTKQADDENVRITEVHYNPVGPSASEQGAGFTDGDQFEFLEVLNVSADTVDFKGVTFGAGLTMSVGEFAELAPGQRGVFVSDAAAFQERYGTGVTILGTYTGNLSNGGEAISLNDNKTGGVIKAFTFEDGTGVGEEGWPTTPDGDGPSLVVIDTEGDYNDGNNWKASTATHGTPGASEAADILGDINGDGFVGAADLDALLAHWGDAASSSRMAQDADLNGDGTVNSPDLSIVIANFGNGTPPAAPTSNGETPDDNDNDNDAVGNDAGGNNPADRPSSPTRPAPTPEATDPAPPQRPRPTAPPSRDPQPADVPPPARPTPPLWPDQQRAASTRTPDALALTRPVSTTPAGEAPGTEPTQAATKPKPRFDAMSLRPATPTTKATPGT